MEKNLKIIRGRLVRPRVWRKPHVLPTVVVVEGEGESWEFRVVRYAWQLTVTPEGHLGGQESKEEVILRQNGFSSHHGAMWEAERLALAMDLDLDWSTNSTTNS